MLKSDKSFPFNQCLQSRFFYISAYKLNYLILSKRILHDFINQILDYLVFENNNKII